MAQPELSILVGSLIERRNNFLNNLLEILEPQLVGKPVELLIFADNAQRVIGEKRNNMLDLANGKYICFVDDDDRVSDDYIDQILSQTAKDPDVVVFNAEITFDGQGPKLVRYGKEYGHYEAEDAYYRRPNHLMVHKKSNIQERFENIGFGEDDEWAARRLNSIMTQERIDKVLYFYDYKTTTKKYVSMDIEDTDIDMNMDIPCSSHQPLLKWLSTFDVKFILELGVGNYSTPIFHGYNFDRMISVENDADWIKAIESKFIAKQNYEIRLHDVGVDRMLYKRQLSADQRAEFESYYQALGLETADQPKLKLLFVDQFTSVRMISMDILSAYFDIIVYHDCQPGYYGIDWYEYSFDEKFVGFNHYLLRSPQAWTGCFIRKELGIDVDGIKPYIEDYCKTYNQNINEWFLTTERS